MSRTRLAVGVVLGAVVGIAVGVLTAPKAGKETRAGIKEKATELKQESRQYTEQAKPSSDNGATDTLETEHGKR